MTNAIERVDKKHIFFVDDFIGTGNKIMSFSLSATVGIRQKSMRISCGINMFSYQKKICVELAIISKKLELGRLKELIA